MHNDHQRPSGRTAETLRASLIMLAFGLSVLAFLVAIDRPHWFRLKPATGTAAAMSHAASSAPTDTTGA